MAGLLGSGSPRRSKTQVKTQGGRGNIDTLDAGLSPAMRGTPAKVEERMFYLQQGYLLSKQLKKNKSSGIKP